MGHAHCTSGAPTCSEIPHSLSWSRKAPIIHDAPRGGTVQILTNRDVKPSGRVLRLCPAFCLREAKWWLQLEVKKTSNLHYTTAQHTTSPVFSHHTTDLYIYILYIEPFCIFSFSYLCIFNNFFFNLSLTTCIFTGIIIIFI